MAALENAAINLKAIQKETQSQINRVFSSAKVDGPFTLIIEPIIMSSLFFVTDGNSLKEHGVVDIIRLTDEEIPTPASQNILFFVRPDFKSMALVARAVEKFRLSSTKKAFHLVFSPRSSLICERILAERGVRGDLIIEEVSFDMVPFDDDILSLELPDSFREYAADGDQTSLFFMARALMKLQAAFGLIPHIRGVGPAAKSVFDMVMRMKKEGKEKIDIEPEIDDLLIFDRTADLETPLLSQLTYEGLLDDIIGINSGKVEVPAELTGQKGNKNVSAALTSADRVFAEIRGMSFTAVGPILREKALSLQTSIAKKDEAQSISDLRAFVKTLSSINEHKLALSIHLYLAQRLKDHLDSSNFHQELYTQQAVLFGESNFDDIEDVLYEAEDLERSIQLLCLTSLANNGLPKKYVDSWRKEIVDNFGHEHLRTLQKLERSGLLPKPGTKPGYATLRKVMRLRVEDEVNDANPNDVSYTYAGYSPIVCRLVQHLYTTGWEPLAEGLRLLPSPIFDHAQTQAPASETSRVPVSLLCFVGGVTRGEIDGIRFLGSVLNRRFIILTTSITNTKNFLRPLLVE